MKTLKTIIDHIAAYVIIAFLMTAFAGLMAGSYYLDHLRFCR